MLSRITLATEDALTWPWYQRLVLTLNSAQHTLGWMWLWNIITPVTVWVRYLNLSLIWRELKQSFPFPPHPGNCSVAGRQWDLISQSRFVFWSCWWEQTSWPRGQDFISGVIGAVLPCLKYEEPESQNAARVPGSPLQQGLFHGLDRLWRRHLHHCGLLRGVPPDRAFMRSKGNISWALQSSAPGFIGTYCFLGLSLKMSRHTADLRTSATHARIEPVPVQRYEHCPDYHQPQFMWETCSPCGFKQ